jgi:hypothetical protein
VFPVGTSPAGSCQAQVLAHGIPAHGVLGVLLPIPLKSDQIDQIRDALIQIYEKFQQGIEPDACVAALPAALGSGEHPGRGWCYLGNPWSRSSMSISGWPTWLNAHVFGDDRITSASFRMIGSSLLGRYSSLSDQPWRGWQR